VSRRDEKVSERLFGLKASLENRGDATPAQAGWDGESMNSEGSGGSAFLGGGRKCRIRIGLPKRGTRGLQKQAGSRAGGLPLIHNVRLSRGQVGGARGENKQDWDGRAARRGVGCISLQPQNLGENGC